MGRPPRIDYPGARHHVMNRGARKRGIFGDAEDCGTFLDLLAGLHNRFGVVVHGYTLMPNHFHLLLESTQGRLSRAMQHVSASYSRALNQRYDWDGPVFKGRFRSRLVLDDGYWMHLLAYLHLNPVRAGLVPTADHAQWSSHHAYVGLVGAPDWLSVDEHLQAFGGQEAYARYVEAVRLKRQRAPAGFDEEALWSSTVAQEVPEQERLGPPMLSPEEAIAYFEKIVARSLADLGRKERPGGPAQTERWLAAWWLERAGLSQREISNLLDASVPLVCRWIKRVRESLADGSASPELADLAARLDPRWPA